MAKLVAKTYGEALYGLAMEDGKAKELLKEFSAVHEVLKLNPKFNRLMNHPKILTEEKIDVLENVFKSRVSLEMAGFLKLLITKDRFGDIEAIFDYFSGKIKDSLGIGLAQVTTAHTISEIKKSQIVEHLISVTKYREMEVDFSVDEKLIGGIVLRIGDRVVDGSILTQLNNIKKQLLNVQYK